MNDTNWKEARNLLCKREFRIIVYAVLFLFGILMIPLSVAVAKEKSGIDYLRAIYAQQTQCFGAVLSLVFGLGMVLELSKVKEPAEKEKEIQ